MDRIEAHGVSSARSEVRVIECPSCQRHIRTASVECPFCRTTQTFDRLKTAVGIGLTGLVLSACYGTVDSTKVPTGDTADTEEPTTTATPEE